jgi:hypothetical protein
MERVAGDPTRQHSSIAITLLKGRRDMSLVLLDQTDPDQGVGNQVPVRRRLSILVLDMFPYGVEPNLVMELQLVHVPGIEGSTPRRSKSFNLL